MAKAIKRPYKGGADNASAVKYIDKDGNESNVQQELTELNKNIDNVNSNLNDCFQSVSDGKSLVASAITDKGVTTSSDATFATMAENIGNISSSITGWVLGVSRGGQGSYATISGGDVPATIDLNWDASYAPLRVTAKRDCYVCMVSERQGQTLDIRKNVVLKKGSSFTGYGIDNYITTIFAYTIG